MIINLEHTDVLNPAICIEHSIAVILLFGSWYSWTKQSPQRL